MRLTAGDKGSVSVELAVLTPAFALMLAFVMLVGRVQSTRADVEAAAHSAARTITLSRDPTGAAGVAQAATEERLQVGGPSCQTMGWDVQITPTEATVTVNCEVNLQEAALLPVPGTLTVEAVSSEVFDVHRENSGEFGISEGSGGSNPSVEDL